MTVQIVDYRKEHQPYFEKFNRDWIEKFFWMEETDTYVLQHPQEAILDGGGAILVALLDGEVGGVVALKKLPDGIFEFTKMAVDEPFRRKGLAEALSHAAMKKARELGARKIILYSQTGLAAAISLYHKLGFQEVPLGTGVYKRSDIKMEIGLGAPDPFHRNLASQ
ncbi:MAG: GNAT family N-acetyltransferase [Flavisolibacter sp.]